jgi:hypothetical protein
MRESANGKCLVSNYFVGNEGNMRVPALRAAAWAGVLVGGLMAGNGAVGIAFADIDGSTNSTQGDQSSKDVNKEIQAQTPRFCTVRANKGTEISTRRRTSP